MLNCQLELILKKRLKTQLFLMVLAFSALAGCASAPDRNDAEAYSEYQAINDPAEPTMRAIFAFNQAIDKAILKPVAKTYRDVASERFRNSAHNFLNNLRSPVILFNDILQGDIDRAFTTIARFLINTTVGILGFNDSATDFGFEFHDEDFGQTLAVWRVPEGPYLMLPILGPSNPRDTVGRVVDFLIDPLNIWAKDAGEEWTMPMRTALEAVDFRALHYETIEDLENTSLDFYAAVRSLYRQRRMDEINNGKVDPSTSVPSIGHFMEDQPNTGKDKEISQAN